MVSRWHPLEDSILNVIRILLHNSTTIACARSSVSVSRTTGQRVLLSFVILSQDSGSFLGHLSRTHPRAFFVEAAAGRWRRSAGLSHVVLGSDVFSHRWRARAAVPIACRNIRLRRVGGPLRGLIGWMLGVRSRVGSIRGRWVSTPLGRSRSSDHRRRRQMVRWNCPMRTVQTSQTCFKWSEGWIFLEFVLFIR